MYKVCNVKVRFKLNCSASVYFHAPSLLRRGLFVLWGGFCVVGAGEKEKESARGTMGRGKRFDGDTQWEPLRRRESRTRKRASSSSLYVRHTCLFRLCLSVITLVLEVWLEDRMRSNKRLVLQSKVLLLF